MTALTRQQKIHLLDDLCAAIDAQAAQMDALHPILSPDPGCPWYDAAFGLINVAIKATAEAIGDKHEWLEWFVLENDCGRKGHEAGYEKRLKPIRTVDDLLDLLEAEEE